jgi:glycosyltransferase involved in cell wall biosynthesis
MPRRLRLLWVIPYVPLRGVMAARERWWHLLARLARRHDVTLLAFADPDDVGRRSELPPGLAAAHLVPKAPWFPDDPLALLPKDVAGGFVHPALRAAIAGHLAGGGWDIVQYELGEMAQCIPGPAPARTILTMHQLGFAQQGPLWRAQRGGIRRAAVLLHRYLRELDFELRALGRVDHVVTMSAEDASRLRRFVPDAPISVSPCGVDCHEFAPPAAPPPSTADLVFVGHFHHPPNADAVRFLVRDVMPRLGRSARIRIVGRAITPDIAALARDGSIDIVGPVDDVRRELTAASVFVAPVRFGTGMRGKVLEALAMGRPVVTTSVGAEGLGATSGRDLVVADGADALAAAIRRVLADPGLAASLGRGGRTLVAAHFDWDTIAAAHEEIYDRVLRGSSRALIEPTRAPALARATGRLGRLPGVAAGFAVLLARAARWHAARLASPARNAARPVPASVGA